MDLSFKKNVLKQAAPEFVRLRERQGLSKEEVAVMADLSIWTIRSIESGQTVAYKKVRKLLQFYNKRLDIRLVDR